MEVLLHPRKCILAVRPTTRDNPNAIEWSRTKDGNVLPKNVAGTAFLPTLLALMGWKNTYSYRTLGVLRGEGAETVLFFDLKEAVAQIPRSALHPDETSEKKKRERKINAYPQEWQEGFGDGFYSRTHGDEYNPDNNETWEVRTAGQPYKEPELSVTEPEVIETEINAIIRDMKEAAKNE